MHLLVEDALAVILFFSCSHSNVLQLIVVTNSKDATILLTRHHPHSPVVNIYDTLKNNSIGS